MQLDASVLNRAPNHRRGTVYLIILISVMIITVIGLSGLYAAQVQGRQVRDSSDALAARLLAEAAIETGMMVMQEDPNWRDKYGGGDWFSDRALGDGVISLHVRDPDDGDVADSNEDPIILRGIGKAGEARQMIEVQFASTPEAITALDAAAHAGRVMAFDGADVIADAPLTSNDSTWASAANVKANVESVGAVIGSTYSGSVATKVAARGMPSSDAITSLTNAATVITMDEIAAVSSNIAANGHVNFSLNNWSSSNCNIGHVKASSYEGEGHIEATDRAGVAAGPVLDVSGGIQNNQSYTVTVRVRVPLANTIRVVLFTESNDAERRSFVVDEGVAALTWTEFSGVITPTWDAGDGLASAVLLVRSTALTTDIEVDAVTMVPTTLDPPVIEHVAISPDRNPYGATNADGIYWIDCQGNDLVIRDCRIHGTLVLSDPGVGTRVEGSVAWTVPGVESALVVDGDLSIAMDNADLDEGNVEVNFNPVGFGSGSEDSDDSDTYPSMIDGLVYATNDFRVGAQSSFDGLLIAGRDLVFNGDAVTITLNPSYAASPPAGYTASSRLTLDRRSWTKVVD